MEGILYRLHVGCPWRDLSKYFGLWNTIYRRFLLWSRKGILLRLFKTLSTNSDTEWKFIDGRYVKAHQHSTGVSSEENQAIGLSCGGNISKIHLAVDSYGLPIEFIVTGGEVHDSKAANTFTEILPQSHFMFADKGYDSEAIRDKVRQCGSEPVIPRRQNSKQENAFVQLKHFRAIATRYEKLKINFESLLALACSIIWLPM
jgi:transposase